MRMTAILDRHGTRLLHAVHGLTPDVRKARRPAGRAQVKLVSMSIKVLPIRRRGGCPAQPTRPHRRSPEPSIHDRIAAFLAGRTDGEDVLRNLYDHVLDEPVPARLQALLRRREAKDAPEVTP